MISMKHQLLRALMVWQNAFYPKIMAALIALMPCVSFQEGGSSFEAYDLGTECDSSAARSTSLTVAVGGALLLGVTGPLMWFVIIRRSREWSDQDTRKGYQVDFDWWEANVLIRNMAVQACAAKIP